MLAQYKQFYLRHGLRIPGEMISPRFSNLEDYSVPQSSTYHYLGSGPLDSGPPSQYPIVKYSDSNVPIYHCTELSAQEGKPQLVPGNLAEDIRRYQSDNRRYRRVMDLNSVPTTPNLPFMVNYAFIHRRYRYPRNVYSNYHRWHNLLTTVFGRARDLAVANERNQFIPFEFPKIPPILRDYQDLDRRLTETSVRKITSLEGLMFYELWKWLGPNRDDSVLALIPADQYSKVNLVIRESGHWVALNLGTIDAMRRAPGSRKGIPPELMQLRLIRLVMSFAALRSGEYVESTGVDGEEIAVPVAGADGEGTAGDMVLTDEELDQRLKEEVGKLERLTANIRDDANEEDEVKSIDLKHDKHEEPESAILSMITEHANQGTMSLAEYQKLEKLAVSYKSIKIGEGETMESFVRVTPQMLAMDKKPVVPDRDTIVDKSMLTDTLSTFDTKYIKRVMQRDIAAMVLSIQNAGVAVTGYNVERVESVTGDLDRYTVRLNPVVGEPSVIKFEIPTLDDDGIYTANGTNYRLRKQRGDLPIRKIAPDRVALTSYYGKVFVCRSEKKAYNYSSWLLNNITAMAISTTDTRITDPKLGDVFDNLAETPRQYSILASKFIGFTAAEVSWNFDYSKRVALYGEDAIKQYEKGGSVLVGVRKKGELVVMAKDGAIYIAEGDTPLQPIGTVESLVGLDPDSAPIDYVELRCMGKNIPLALVLSYRLGYDTLVKSLGVYPRVVPIGTRLKLAPNEYAVFFSDEVHVFSTDDEFATMILSGLREVGKSMRQFARHEFNRRSVYLNVLESIGLGMSNLREVDHLFMLFVDPITKGLLEEMGEPTNFRGLLVRSAELLMTDYHPDELDIRYMRIKGNERMAGAVYAELVRAVRAHAAQAGRKHTKIDMKPFAVWKAITADPAVSMLVETNPVQDLKEKEMATYAGTGGRMAEAMTKRTRAYHPNDMGVISEATSDSADVGINTGLSASPNLVNLRGTSSRFDLKNPDMTSLLSTSALLAPASLFDDAKRLSFVSIQNTHALPCVGYSQSFVRTGYEQVVPYRTTELYCYTAKEPGTVVSVDSRGVLIKLDSGETKGIKVGRRYGSAAGLTVPHELVANCKAGDRFREGDALVYNSGFFEQDILNPTKVVMKMAALVKTVLMECSDTLEDSSAISQRVSDLIKTYKTEKRSVVLEFNQAIHRTVRPGQRVEAEDYLMLIEDSVTAENDLFDEETVETLRLLAAQAPKCKSKGVVERIEAFYYGDKDDMSESIREIADHSDRELHKQRRSIGKTPTTGQVDEKFRFGAESLEPGTVLVNIYITTEITAGVGDKGVFANQLKTVFGRTMGSNTTTEDGTVIDAIFGQKSIADRIVLSPEIMGTTNVLLDLIKKKALAAYKA